MNNSHNLEDDGDEDELMSDGGEEPEEEKEEEKEEDEEEDASSQSSDDVTREDGDGNELGSGLGEDSDAAGSDEEMPQEQNGDEGSGSSAREIFNHTRAPVASGLPKLMIDMDGTGPGCSSSKRKRLLIKKNPKRTTRTDPDFSLPSSPHLPLRNSALSGRTSFASTSSKQPEQAHLSPKTIRRIMSYITRSHDVRISHPAVKAVALAMECFIQSFVREANRRAERQERNLVKYSDISYVANHFSPLYFLQDFLPAQQPAGFVVRKILDNSGVDVEQDFRREMGESEEEPQPSMAADDPRVNPMTAPERREGNVLAQAVGLAKKWDSSKSRFGDWRSLEPKSDPRKRDD
ncbi:hypothetical protein BV898_18048 [Hypsibius exemplaris]|uniref:Transcription factor CBF/NF-Y/archaeal histone domain-containing protein n=1 Tax=Hypsibius exemplaris TaxID=2072580 RepID=A0A9X6NGN1_HYPEX|nr:hypothetical protein BV898_18048 [Hypsibius exemplaris]